MFYYFLGNFPINLLYEVGQNMHLNKKIAFIGYGNMAQAIAHGVARAGLINEADVLVIDVDTEKKELAKQAGFTVTENPAFEADIVIIATKPQQYADVITEIKDELRSDAIIVSIAAGLTINTLENLLGRPVKLVRTMPNTPAMVGAGMTAIMPNSEMTTADTQLIIDIFSSFGITEIVDESLIEAVIVTSGSSPAYIYMMIEAMIQGGIAEGMNRQMATRFVTQAVLGATMMVDQTDKLPNDLRDAVCSPNGTTIEAVKSLQANGFEQNILTAMKACADRSRAMAKNEK